MDFSGPIFGQRAHILEYLCQGIERQTGYEVGMSHHIWQGTEKLESAQRNFQAAFAPASLEHVLVKALDACLQMQQAGGHFAEQGF